MSPNITEIQSTSQYDEIARSLPTTQLLVIDQTWCGPCHAIAPVLEQLAGTYKHVRFVKVDVDRQAALAQRFQIRAMPTFKFIRGNREVDELRGASPPQLSALIARHAGPVPASSAASSSSGAKPASPPSAAAKAAPANPADAIVSLLPQVSTRGLVCLNESKDHPLSSILGSGAGPKGRSWLESDVDPELLITIPFNEAVKLKSISIFSGVSPAQAPKDIKLFINHAALDFGDTETLPAAQELTLTEADIRGERVDLRFVRFQNVRSLHILVKSNQEDEETTRIDSIDVFGTIAQSTEKGPLVAQPEE
ncbi:hypothetical protein Q5752_002561 [Cryptotrichosporon argae]